MADDVLCVRVSPDSRLLAVSLLDSTIKVREEGRRREVCGGISCHLDV